jgi:tetratricopeptide (TPR) repeat protein
MTAHTISRVFGIALVSISASAASRAQCSATIQKLYDERRFDDARAQAEPIAKRKDADARSAYCVGRIAAAQDKSNEAVDWLERAVDRDANVAEYHLWLGNALGEEAQKASKFRQPFLARRVKSEFETAVRLDPSSIDARHGLIQFYSVAPGIMGGSMENAKAQAREIAKLNRMRGHLEMAVLVEREKNLADAEREFQAAITAAPDSNAGYNGLINFYARQRRWDQVFTTIEQFMRAKPDERSAKLAYARAAALSGQNLDRGEAEVKSWLAAPPADVQPAALSVAHTRLGAIYEKQGKSDSARVEYDEAVRLNAKNAEAARLLKGVRD